ncbi:hypothetical protein CDAR_479161 [Caerostris darwini]|uniref:Uncharacterized protein n=1 Tax=Caerostris darwini TaxID=1538125 RepID=A0AAV4UVR3_9ARAC|nr:hypothetical protein CDAR_479161 [Caerostris darwini]
MASIEKQEMDFPPLLPPRYKLIRPLSNSLQGIRDAQVPHPVTAQLSPPPLVVQETHPCKSLYLLPHFATTFPFDHQFPDWKEFH